MKYRSDTLFGDGYRDAAKVMAHETFELMNTDIIVTLRNTILKGTPFAEKLEILEEEIQNDCIANGDDGKLYNLIETHDSYGDDSCESIQFFKDILSEIKTITGKDVKYVLWLCDTKDDVHAYDLHNELTDDDIDAYVESDIILSDMGSEGKLYGFETDPKPVS